VLGYRNLLTYLNLMEETYFCWTTLITSAPRIINVISHMDTEQVEPDIRILTNKMLVFWQIFLLQHFHESLTQET